MYFSPLVSVAGRTRVRDSSFLSESSLGSERFEAAREKLFNQQKYSMTKPPNVSSLGLVDRVVRVTFPYMQLSYMYRTIL